MPKDREFDELIYLRNENRRHRESLNLLTSPLEVLLKRRGFRVFSKNPREDLLLPAEESGRLLPQIVSFAAASLQVEAAGGRPAGFIIPSGNLGHALACMWAREMGLPIGGIVLAHNANRTVPDYVASGQWRPRPSVATIANAMDVGDPSNMERIFHLYHDHQTLTARLSAISVDDDAIRNRIRAEAPQAGWIPCPHTAVAAEAWHRMPAPERRRLHWIVVATAHPAKFPEVVEPLVGRALMPPPALAQLLERPVRRTAIAANLDGLRAVLVAT